MRFTQTNVKGAFVIDPEPQGDERGLFARTYCSREFQEHHLPCGFVQCNTSWSSRRGTLRGLHFQQTPSQESKLVRCTAGAIWDVIVDMRAGSPTFRQHVAVELTAENRRALFVPARCAHGFLTRADATEVFYQMGDYYAPELADGLRFDDPALKITWPDQVTVISDKDMSWPLL